jgi:hypothetical protein
MHDPGLRHGAVRQSDRLLPTSTRKSIGPNRPPRAKPSYLPPRLVGCFAHHREFSLTTPYSHHQAYTNSNLSFHCIGITPHASTLVAASFTLAGRTRVDDSGLGRICVHHLSGVQPRQPRIRWGRECRQIFAYSVRTWGHAFLHLFASSGLIDATASSPRLSYPGRGIPVVNCPGTALSLVKPDRQAITLKISLNIPPADLSKLMPSQKKAPFGGGCKPQRRRMMAQ